MRLNKLFGAAVHAPSVTAPLESFVHEPSAPHQTTSLPIEGDLPPLDGATGTQPILKAAHRP